MGLTYFDDDVSILLAAYGGEERDLPHRAEGRASDEERVTLSFRDLRAVVGLAIVGSNLTPHD